MKVLLTVLFLIISSIVFADGKGLFIRKSCVVCHGTKAEGQQILKAPALAGQRYEYLLRQLKNFQKKTRGLHEDGNDSSIMWQIASSLSEGEMQSIAGYLSKLKPTTLSANLSGFPLKGKQYFAICIACHGEEGLGNDQQNAPNLSVLNDWYVAEQMIAFKTGKRGRNDANPIAMQMAPMALTVPDDSIRDLALYIKNLKDINQ